MLRVEAVGERAERVGCILVRLDADATTSRCRASRVDMSVQHKINRTANAPQTAPDETEIAVAQALIDLENTVPELKAELRPLQISAAREVDVRGGKKAIVIFVPVPQLKAFHKVQQRCVCGMQGWVGTDAYTVLLGTG